MEVVEMAGEMAATELASHPPFLSNRTGNAACPRKPSEGKPVAHIKG
jgi:hypothetical protein